MKKRIIGIDVARALALIGMIIVNFKVEDLTPISGTEPMPPMPMYMLNGMAIGIVLISGCILLARR